MRREVSRKDQFEDDVGGAGSAANTLVGRARARGRHCYTRGNAGLKEQAYNQGSGMQY